jgi:hypothetical protein
MIELNTYNNNSSDSILNTNSRLAIKNIPENFSNQQILDLLTKNFENMLKNIDIIKLEHKYNLKNNKICFLTAENLDIRKKVIDFFSVFELVDPKGFKQKLIVVDCLYQNKFKSNKDSIENTIDKSKSISYFINS